jgi:hypothetical protein
MIFNKEITLGNILTMIVLVGTVLLGFARFQTRLSVIELSEQARLQQGQEIKQEMKEMRRDMKTLITELLKERK